MTKPAARILGMLSLFFSIALWSQTALAPDSYKQLKYRYIGPVGNRATAVAGIAGNPWIYYVGAASGGIFKTTDGGTHWEPIFDGQDVSSIGSLALAPSNPNIVWAGTGESFVRSHISVGTEFTNPPTRARRGPGWALRRRDALPT